MTAAISPILLADHSPWSQCAYDILDDMNARGNLAARLIQSELRQLDAGLAQIRIRDNTELTVPASALCELGEPIDVVPPSTSTGYNPSLEPDLAQSFAQHYELSSDQLLELANSLDIDGLTFPVSSLSGYFSDNDS